MVILVDRYDLRERIKNMDEPREYNPNLEFELTKDKDHWIHVEREIRKIREELGQIAINMTAEEFMQYVNDYNQKHMHLIKFPLKKHIIESYE